MEKNTVISVFGERIEIIVPSASTNYTCCVGVQTSPPGGGPPPHKHEREEETFVVLEGEFDFYDGSAWTPITQGDVRCSIRGHHHAFRNRGTAPGRMLFATNSGGLDEYFALISPLTMPQDRTVWRRSAGTMATCFKTSSSRPTRRWDPARGGLRGWSRQERRVRR